MTNGTTAPSLAPATTQALSAGRARLSSSWRARLSFAITGLALGAAMFVSLGGPQAALADEKTDEVYDEHSGIVIEIYVNDKGQEWYWMTYADGEVIVVTFDDNPNPDDDGRGNVYTPESVRDAIRKFGGAIDPPQDKWDNPLGVQLTQQGEGYIPAHNPSDFEKGYDDGTGFTGDMPFDPNGGDFTQQLKKNGGGSETSDDDDSDDPDRGEAGLFDEAMPGPPPLVNPAPVTAIGR